MSGSVSAASGSSNTATASADDAASAPDGEQPDGVLLQQGKAFRGLMDGLGSATDGRGALPGRGGVPQRGEGDPGAFDSGVGAGFPSDSGSGSDSGLGSGTSPQRSDVDVAAQLLAQRLLDPGVMLQSAAPAAMAPDATFAELMEKHIRRALVSSSAGDDCDGGEIRLELSDAVLPSTTLSLRRTADWWQLHAATTNSQSREALSRFAPTLVARFAQSALGQLHLQIT